MQFLRSNAGKGTFYAFLMALVLVFPASINFIVAAILLNMTIHHFQLSFGELDNAEVIVEQAIIEQPENDALPAPHDSPLAIRL